MHESRFSTILFHYLYIHFNFGTLEKTIVKKIKRNESGNNSKGHVFCVLEASVHGLNQNLL